MFIPTWLRSSTRTNPTRKRGLWGAERLEFRNMLATFQGLGLNKANDISDDGLVVVGSHGGQAARWTQVQGITQLGILPGGSDSTAYGVSADGAVIVGASDSAQSFSNWDEAFRWTAATGMVGLGDLPGGEFISTARGVSADGTVITGESDDGVLQEQRGFRWTAATGMTALPILPGTDGDSVMFGISADGQTIVGRNRSTSPANPNYAVQWTEAAGTVTLGRLPGDTNSRANAASADGSVIVGTSYAATGQGVRWVNGVIEGLGRVPGTAGSWTTDASGDGSVVVGWNYFADLSSAGGYIWDAAHGIRDVQTVLQNDYGLASALAGWNFNVPSAVTGISADGRVIVGNAINPLGGNEAWMAELTPTDPGAPSVDAGPNQTILAGSPAALDGTVTDNNGGDAPTVQWSVVSGPGTVTFGDASAEDTTATFTASGIYELRLTATDGSLSSFDAVYVTVNPLSADLTPSADTYISNASKEATKNFGGATGLIADGNPDKSTLVRWDLSGIPAGSIILSATLSVNVGGTSGDTYEIYEVLQNWAESQATWTKATTTTNWQTAGALGATDRGTTVLGTITASTTGIGTVALGAAGLAAVQGWVNNPSSNNGLILQDYTNSTNDDLVLSSRESAVSANRPRLILTYVPSGPPAAPSSVVVSVTEARTPARDVRVVSARQHRSIASASVSRISGSQVATLDAASVDSTMRLYATRRARATHGLDFSAP